MYVRPSWMNASVPMLPLGSERWPCNMARACAS